MKKKLLFLWVLLVLPILAMGETGTIQGKIKAPNPAWVSELPIMLLKMTMNEDGSPNIIPFMKGKTDTQGNFTFTIENLETQAFYRVGAFVQGEALQTEALHFTEKKNLEVEMVMKGAAPALLEGKRTIKGKIQSKDLSLVSELPVMLLKITLKPDGTPAISPFMKGKTDTQGNFIFELENAEERALYRVGAFVNGEGLGSEMVSLAKNKVVELNLAVPETIQGLNGLKILSNILTLEPLTEGVQVIENLVVENPGKSVMDGSTAPWTKSIPAGATNFQSFHQDGKFVLKEIGGKVEFQLRIPPGEHEILYSYDLPSSWTSINFEHYLFPGTPKVELRRREGRMSTHFLGKMIPEFSNEVGKEKIKIFTKTLEISNNEPSVQVQVESLPVHLKYYLYPAILLLISLLAGMYWFLKTKLFAPAR